MWIQVSLTLIQAFCGLFGLYAVFKRSVPALKVLQMVYSVMLVAAAMSVLSDILSWTLGLCGVLTGGSPWVPSDGDYLKVIVESSFKAVFFATAFWALRAMRSLQAVISVGGTGFEKMNYFEVQDKLRQQNEEGLSDMLVSESGGDNASTPRRVSHSCYNLTKDSSFDMGKDSPADGGFNLTEDPRCALKKDSLYDLTKDSLKLGSFDKK
eukprot:CAMPEP_0113845804 /NCGR_PEP_ID=MMETSP0372-20130328/960_1 /TAXON_ID=340204 /ORGANISM="Lankesteria abbotti" /LENGTH=209 /DNA_ID=CAMNT_0000814887 /DNA_START=203 /DNA_END=832 /DNA_ORIENTATION=+ /assembly_acc=CAM_ASM_000359